MSPRRGIDAEYDRDMAIRGSKLNRDSERASSSDLPNALHSLHKHDNESAIEITQRGEYRYVATRERSIDPPSSPLERAERKTKSRRGRRMLNRIGISALSGWQIIILITESHQRWDCAFADAVASESPWESGNTRAPSPSSDETDRRNLICRVLDLGDASVNNCA